MRMGARRVYRPSIPLHVCIPISSCDELALEHPEAKAGVSNTSTEAHTAAEPLLGVLQITVIEQTCHPRIRAIFALSHKDFPVIVVNGAAAGWT